jgi:hypothetical protein
MFWNTTETETSGPPTSERPDWLTVDADTESQSGKAWDTADKPASTTNQTMEISPSSNTKTTAATSTDKGPWCKRLTIMGFSALFAAAFIYAALTGKGGGSKLVWYIYYAISAAIPIFFLCHYILCFPVKVIYALSLGMAVWSIVNVVMASLDLKDHSKSEDKSVHKDLIWELAGVSAGLFSALYHGCASRCFVTPKGKSEE